MGALMRVAADAGALESGFGDHRNRAARCKADVGRQRAQKQLATRRPRATIAQVGGDSGANVCGHWHPRSLSTLGANERLARSPVDVIQGEGRDLIRPQAELAQHHEDGIVPPPQRCRSITTIEDVLNLRGRQIGRQAGELPSPDGGHAAGQRERV